jgi:hypothetical protein
MQVACDGARMWLVVSPAGHPFIYFDVGTASVAMDRPVVAPHTPSK